MASTHPTTRTVTIVGSTGNTGLPLLKLLAWRPDLNLKIQAVTRDATKAKSQHGHLLPGIEFVTVDGNAEDKSLVDAALKGAEELVFMRPFFAEDYGKAYAERWVEGARRAGTVKRIHLLSGHAGLSMLEQRGMGIIGLESEKPVTESEFDWTVLRPTFFHTNAFGWAEQIKKSGTLSMPWGYQRFAGIGPEDIAAAFFQILIDGPTRHSKKIFRLTVRDLLDGPTVAAAFSRALGRPIKYNPITPEEYKQYHMSLGMPAPAAEFTTQLMVQVQQGEYAHTFADLKDLTGRDGVSFEQWVFENAQAFK